MINIVHRVFGQRRLPRNIDAPARAASVLLVATALGIAAPGIVTPTSASARSWPEEVWERIIGRTAEPPLDGRFACGPERFCPGRRPPGPPDRDARPFEGTLGRPCAYRVRFTPSGERRMRVCF